MNALPVGPQKLADAANLARYFDDLERWGFDIAYNAYYAFDYEDVVGKYKGAYSGFVQEAHRRGYPACIQIQSTVCAGDKLTIEEAQYDLDNQPEKRDDKRFFASFSSEAWRNYLKDLTTVFVQDYGFDYVVYEEPMYRVDIPGTKDRFHAKFTAEHPDLGYPDERRETPLYLKVQEAKAQAVIEFYSDLVAHAKSVGARKVGLMPWFFIPTVENTPAETLNPSCDTSRLAQIPGLDSLVVRMQPDNILANTMRTGDDLQTSPALYYVEVMAHALGKDLIAVSNPSNEHTDQPKPPLIPAEFYRQSVLASLAAQPCGFTRHWYGQNYGKDEAHMQALTEASGFATRLGAPKSPVAFVFSYSGTRHASPLTYETVFAHYWALARHMAVEAHSPMLTFYAETLERNLAEHPEVRVLVLDEHFPLSLEQMMVISRWWRVPQRRALVAFGSGLGFVADTDSPGLQPCARSFPGVLELIGLRQEDQPQYRVDSPVSLNDVARVRRTAFLGDDLELDVSRIANVRRVFGSRAAVLYEIETAEGRIPVAAQWRDRASLALFCGFGLSDQTAAAAEKAVAYALDEADAPPSMIDSCTEGILWGMNRNDYVVVSNLSEAAGKAVAHPGRAYLWDCRAERLLCDPDVAIDVEPYSFRAFRVVPRRSKFFDIKGVSVLKRLVDGAGRAEIDITAGQSTTLVLRASPRDVRVDGRPCTVTQEAKDGAYHVTLQQCPAGDRRISLRW